MKKLITTILATIALTIQSHASNLLVVNGDFSDITGLQSLGGGWYSGVPAGWNGVDTSYTVLNYGGDFVINLSRLASTNPWNPLTQNVGLLDSDSDITLKFDILKVFDPNTVTTGVAIYGIGSSGNQGLLANSSFNEGANQTLSVQNVLAGTDLQIAFWNAGGLSALDNVQIVSASVIPEPTTLDLISLPIKIGVCMVDTISNNIYSGGINSRKFNALTIVY